jgi:hypothetical protein
MYIVGGSNGECTSPQTWKINFEKKEATNLNRDLDLPTALNKVMVTTEKNNSGELVKYTLMCFGGIDS